MQPPARSLDVEACLILMQDGSRNQGVFESLFERDQVDGTSLDQGGERTLAHCDPHEIREDFTHSRPRHELLVCQVNGDGPHAWAILDPRIHPSGEGGATPSLACRALLVLCLMFLHQGM